MLVFIGQFLLFGLCTLLLGVIWHLRRLELRLPGARRWALTACAVVIGTAASYGDDLLTLGTNVAGALFCAWAVEFLVAEREMHDSFGKFLHSAWSDLLIFIRKILLALIFPVTIFTALMVTHYIPFPLLGLGHYDWLLLLFLTVQVLLVKLKVESVAEVKTITWFHLLGLAMELFKVNQGSWSYPEPALTKFFGVPLYSGFMYASVASFLIQVWHRLNLTLEAWPRTWLVALLGGAIYLNFFTHHFVADIRWLLILGIFFVFFRSRVVVVNTDKVRTLPLVGTFLGLGFFIWIAENIATFFGAWAYPDQEAGWQMVHIGKIQSWFLLGIISFMLVAQLKQRHENSRG